MRKAELDKDSLRQRSRSRADWFARLPRPVRAGVGGQSMATVMLSYYRPDFPPREKQVVEDTRFELVTS